MPAAVVESLVESLIEPLVEEVVKDTYATIIYVDGKTSASAIKTQYESNADTNAFTNALKSKLNGIQAGAQVNPTAGQTKTQYESNDDTNAFTDAEKSKLASLESSKFVGQYTSLALLQLAHPTPSIGSYAFVDPGFGSDVIKYIWDSNDTKWVSSGAVNQEITAAQVKALYESNADTNAFTNTLKGKLDGIQTGAQVNPSASAIKTQYESNADTNAFTDTEKTKLSGIQAGAQVNIKPNWNAVSGNAAEILNKPTIDGLLGELASLGFVKRNGANSYTIDTSTYQPLDADLTSIASLSGTSGFLKKTASNTWSLDTSVYLTAITKAMVEAVLTGTITTHTHNASDIVEDVSHRFVTDTEKNTWNAKQNALGFTPENVANKKTTLTDNDVDYPTTKAVKTAIDTAVSQILKPMGNWNASTNTPELTNSDISKANQVYYVNVAGTQFGITFGVGDELVYNTNGVIFRRDNVDAVISINGKEGVVVLTQDDVADGSTYKRVTNTEKTTWNNKQDKLTAGDNISIVGNTISASGGSGITDAPADDKLYGRKNSTWEEVQGGEVDMNAMAYFDYAGSIYGAKYSQLVNAWNHSLTVDPLEIGATSTTSEPRGLAQYPNNATEGIVIPHSVTVIGQYAFYNSNNNQPLVIPNGVTSISGGAFMNWTSNNQPLVIPNSVTYIGGAFSGWSSNNQPLVIPNSVTSVGDSAFGGWSANNQPLVIPNSVTTIGYAAFNTWTSNNQPLVIPSSVTIIAAQAFIGWTNVPYIEIKATTPPTLSNINAFNNQYDAPIYVPDESVNNYKTNPNWMPLEYRIFGISEKDTPEVPSLPKPIYQTRINHIDSSGTTNLFNYMNNSNGNNPNGLSEFDQTNMIYKRVKEITFTLREEEVVDWENPPAILFSEFKRIQSITIPLLIEYMVGIPGEPPIEQLDLSLFYPIIFKKLDGTDVTIKVKTLSGNMLTGTDDPDFSNLQVEITNIQGWGSQPPVGSPVQIIQVSIKYESRY